MIGWLIVGGVALLALRQRPATIPQPGGAVVMKPILKTMPPALPHGPVAQAIGGNEPVLPGKPVPPQLYSVPTNVPGINFNPSVLPSATITKLADQTAGVSVAKNLQIGVSLDKAMGSYTGYGVPLSGAGLFAPINWDDTTQIFDSGSAFTFGSGPLAG